MRKLLPFLLMVSVVYCIQPTGANSQNSSPTVTLWRDPGDVSSFDFAAGPGGAEMAPKPPFQFIEESFGGATVKVMVRDANKRIWSVKFGIEAPSEVFATKLAWAAGYWVQPTYFVAKGRILNAGRDKALERARTSIHPVTGAFQNARFELRDKNPRFVDGEAWSWADNPFIGTPELKGLRILMMLLSNWDTKDAGDSKNPNTAIFENAHDAQRYYVFTDWGASMGKWGSRLTREKWDCKGYAKQSGQFIKGTRDGYIVWGFRGKNREEITAGIQPEDVRWLMRYLGQVSDDQLRAGLATSGATEKEVACYTAAIRDRLEQLRKVAGGSDEVSDKSRMP